MQPKPTQAPFEHLAPGPQIELQPPQLLGSLLMSVQPLTQQTKPGLQVGPPLHVAVHEPAWQIVSEGQPMKQLPQWFGSLSMSVQPSTQQV